MFSLSLPVDIPPLAPTRYQRFGERFETLQLMNGRVAEADFSRPRQISWTKGLYFEANPQKLLKGYSSFVTSADIENPALLSS